VSNATSLLKRVLAWAVVGVALAAVFLTYLQPALAFDLATRMWSCFG
jgi:uncharacterized membrane protein YraQ (UPF0718 family)